MSRIRTMIEISCFDRQDTAVYLRAKLGPDYSWQKQLELWGKKERGEGLCGRSNLYLLPTCRRGRIPLYSLDGIDAFIAQVRDAFPELKPQPLKPVAYEVSADALDCPGSFWRLCRARRCTRTTSPTT